MRRKILIFACEAPPGGNNFVSGGSLRIWSIAEGLKSLGHEIIFSVPIEIAEKSDSEYIDNSFDIKNINSLITKINPDIIFFEQWGLASYLDKVEIPVIFDLHGSLIMENLFRDHRNFTSNATAKIKTFSKADYIICAGERQKRYFLAWYMMSGFNLVEENNRIITLPVSFPLFDKTQNINDVKKDLRIVFGGQMWPWIDPFPGLNILADKVENSNASLDLFVGKPKLTKVLPKDSTYVNVNSNYDKLKNRNNINFNPLISREELLKHYLSSSIAYDVYQPNFERDLAFTTRTVEYLWCGLPVIYSGYQELSQYIKEYNAGFIVDPNNETQIKNIIDTIINDPEIIYEKSQNATKLAYEKFNIFETIKVLEDILENPLLRKKERSLFENITYKEEALETAEELIKLKNKEIEKMHKLSLEKDEEIKDEQKKVLEKHKEINNLNNKISELKNKVNRFQYMYSCVKHDAIMYREQKRRFMFKYFKRSKDKIKKLCFQYPMLLWLFICNYYINSQMNSWIKKHSKKIFLGQ